jgi:hypothetical protein
MAGLVPAIHVSLSERDEAVDARDKPGHDEHIMTGHERHSIAP